MINARKLVRPLAAAVVLVICALWGPAGGHAANMEIWREPSTGMEFVRVEGGCFTMGSPPAEEGRDSDEEPMHEVCLDEYWIGRTEVTVAQFRTFVEKSGYKTDAEREGYSWVYNGDWEKRRGYNWRKVGFEQGDNHPVVHVSWNDAKALAQWLSSSFGKVEYRLPTEAEWEYACRAGTESSRYWGDDPREGCIYANGADRTTRKPFPAWNVAECRDDYIYTAPAKSFRPNEWELHDMLGNVWEWCEDRYTVGAYAKHERKNPVMGGGGATRVIRGGSWYSRPEHVRCAGRESLHSPERRSYDLGFRLVRVVK